MSRKKAKSEEQFPSMESFRRMKSELHDSRAEVEQLRREVKQLKGENHELRMKVNYSLQNLINF